MRRHPEWGRSGSAARSLPREYPRGTYSLFCLRSLRGPGDETMGALRYLRRIGGPMTTIGAGLVMAYAGFAADFYKHEIEKAGGEVETIWSPVHLPIFLGMGIVAAGFLWAGRRAGRRVFASPS